MRLRRIKLAGFKSFVDPTVLHLTSPLTAVVGPNGSGKSNIIDAVRWVMGESSAKHLRGGAMADVIFNGSASRKPVSQASVELVFDNSDGRLGGAYARYAEISVKRLVNREGQSVYYLNGSRCRRRDITDLFLGTGLGPRSYAIIEQGMITRLIEARPEELRAIIEEAAGISRYKERRRETETRIRHTQENLSRLKDIQEEVEKQLEKLRRQARTAERYKALREEQRRLAGERLALEWRELSSQAEQQRRHLAQAKTDLEQAVARLRAAERGQEEARQRRDMFAESFNQAQADYYQSGAALSAREQDLKYARERLQRLEREAERLEETLETARRTVNEDRRILEELIEQRRRLAPTLDRLREQEEALEEQAAAAEEEHAAWQRDWEAHAQQAAEPQRRAEVARARIEQLEQRLTELDRRRQRLASEAEDLDTITPQAELEALNGQRLELQQRLEEGQQAHEQSRRRLTEQRSRREALEHQRDRLRQRRHGLQGRIEALQAWQEQQTSEIAQEWLEAQELHRCPAVLETIEVESGWERAVERVLGALLHARLTSDITRHFPALGDLNPSTLALLEDAPRVEGERGLAAKVSAPQPLVSLLSTIHPVSDLEEARLHLETLDEAESLITPEGLWLGKGWLQWQGKEGQDGTLVRARELRGLEGELATVERDLRAVEEELAAVVEAQKTTEDALQRIQQSLQQTQRQQASLEGRMERLQAQCEQAARRREELVLEGEELAEQRQALHQALQHARTELQQSLEAMEQTQRQREELQDRGEVLRERWQETREALRQQQQQRRQAELEWQRLITQIHAREEGLARAEQRLEEYQQRQCTLAQECRDARGPLIELEKRLEAALEQRAQLERRLSEARAALEDEESALRQSENERHHAEGEVERRRSHVDEQRLALQTLQVRLEGLEGRLREQGHPLERLLEGLPARAEPQEWDRRLEDLARAIDRLGPINLAAIDEHRELSERKGYLDAQRADLEEALTTLEGAIRKIDRETRARFKATFDEINTGLKNLFPRLFGGGQAYLELLDDDLLESGVGIMARPPGKRISNIHLLSGGEKALTAVALVFAIFQLNPAPFCMLDEVDAPLDEANVGRFCRLVEEMSQRVQFIIITHNKTTMEIAEQLHGVTMQEAGVSRLVSVDVVEAVELATA